MKSWVRNRWLAGGVACLVLLCLPIQAFSQKASIQEVQVKGLYRVKNQNLRVLHAAVIQQLETFSSYAIESIPREENREADRLANRAIERGIAEGQGKGGDEEKPMDAPHQRS